MRKIYFPALPKCILFTSFSIISLCVPYSGVIAQVTQTFTSSTTWVCPAGVTSVTVQCWGGGGAGGSAKGSLLSNSAYGGGGAGGAYVSKTLTVTPLTSYTVTVGAAVATSQTNGAVVNGNPSWFNTAATVYAEGGAGGVSKTGGSGTGAGGIGSSGASIGTTLHAGGNGVAGASGYSGGGGSSAGILANGNAGTTLVGGIAPYGGGAGGAGTVSGNGTTGSSPGGGGGGAASVLVATIRTGGGGAAGQVVLTYAACPGTPAITPSGGTVCSNGVQSLSVSSAFNTTQGGTTGTGTTYNGSTTYPNPLNTTAFGEWTQCLVTAAQLSAMGYIAGSSINAVSLNVQAVNGNVALKNFTISMGATAQAALTSTFIPTVTQLYTNPSYTVVAGANTWALSTPFYWNGSSNVVVEFIFDGPTSTILSGGGASTYYTATAANTVTYYSDVLSAGSVAAVKGTGYTLGTTSTQLPNITFSGSNPATTWSPVGSLFTNAGGTISYTGTALPTVYAKPVATTTYTVAATNTACTITNAATLTISSSPLWTGNVNTDWNTPGNWCNGTVPTSATAVTIPSGVTNYPVISVADAVAASVSIAGGASLTMSGANNLTISAGGTFNNAGTFLPAASTGAVIFAGTGTVAGTVNFNNVTINGAVDFGITPVSTVTGKLTINTGGSASGAATHLVTYGTASALIYNTTAITTGNEWYTGGSGTVTPGAGIPQDVLIQSGSVTIPNAGGANRALAGNLVISSGATLQIIAASSRDLYIAGNWTNSGGTFTANGRTVTFDGASSTQAISGTTTFYNLTLQNSVAFGSSVSTIANTFSNSAGTMDGGSSTVIFTGTAGSIIGSSSKNFYNLQVNSPAAITHTTGSGSIHIDNSFVNNGSLAENAAYTFYFDKSGATETMSGTGATSFGNLTIGGGSLSFPTTLNTGTSVFTITGNALSFNSNSSSLHSAGTVTFALTSAGTSIVKNATGVTGTAASFYNVQVNTPASLVSTALDFGSGISSISNSLTLNKLGSVITDAPVYGSTATLIYNTTSLNYPTGLEWSVNATTPGTGVPKNVTIQNTDKVVLSGSRGIGGTFTIGSVNVLNLNNNTLTLNGAYIGTGSLTGSAASGLIINGTAGTAYFTPGGTTNVLQTLTVNGSGSLTLGDSCYITAGSLAGTVTADGIINSGGNLILRSDINGTAQAGASAGSINGNVTVERYIATGTASPLSHSKSWQFLAVPTQGQTIKNAWQEGANTANGNPHPGFGTMLTSNVANAATQPTPGFDAYTTPGPSIKVYNPATGNYDGPATTALPVYNKRGYFIFVRGDRSVALPGQQADSTILRTTGTLFTATNPPPSTNIGVESFESIGNPYASSIDMRQITKTTGVEEFIQVWDPRIGGSYNYGAFVTFLFDGTNYVVGTNGGGSYGPNGSISNYIQSGQAFFMQTAPGMSGTVSFTEAAKGGSTGIVFTRQSGGNSSARISVLQTKSLRATLKSLNTGDSSAFLDGTFCEFDNSYSNSIDYLDARKAANPGENLSIRSAGKLIAIERRQNIISNDTIFLNLANMRMQQYQLQLDAQNLNATEQGFIEDTYKQTRTPLNLNGSTDLAFTIENAAGSYAADRFRLVFSPLTVLPFTFTSVKAYLQSPSINVEWKVDNENNIKQYKVERSANGIDFTTLSVINSANNKGGTAAYMLSDSMPLKGLNYYRIRSVNLNGRVGYTAIVKVTMDIYTKNIMVSPNPVTNGQVQLHFINEPAGRYTIQLLNNAGQVITKREIQLAEGTATELINPGFNLAHGIYKVKVTSPDESIRIINVLY